MIRFGIMGAGRIANKFCQAVGMVDGAQICAVGGKDSRRAAAFAADNRIENWYTSYDEMLLKAKPDAVYIATTNHLHYDNLMLAISHGVPVLCEKPLVMTGREAREVFQKAREKGVFVMEAMWSRFLPGYLKAREWILSGEIGQVVSANYELGFRADQGSRVFDPRTGGGALYDIGVYGIEGLQGLIDQPLKDTSSEVVWTAQGVDITTHLTLRFDPCLASVRCTTGASIPSFAVLNGSKGRITMLDVNNAAYEVTLTRDDGSVERFDAPVQNGFQYQISHFMDCLQKGLLESPVIPHRDTLLCAEIFDKTLKK